MASQNSFGVAEFLYERFCAKGSHDDLSLAMSTVQTITAAGQFWLTFIGIIFTLLIILIAVFGFIGWEALKKESKLLAVDKLDKYLQSEDFKKTLETKVDEATKSHVKEKFGDQIKSGTEEQEQNNKKFPQAKGE